MNKPMKIVAGIGAGGGVGALGVIGARKVAPSVLGALKKLPVFGPWFNTSPRAQQFAADMLVAVMAAPGVVVGHAIVSGKGPVAAAKEGVASVAAAK